MTSFLYSASLVVGALFEPRVVFFTYLLLLKEKSLKTISLLITTANLCCLMKDMLREARPYKQNQHCSFGMPSGHSFNITVFVLFCFLDLQEHYSDLYNNHKNHIFILLLSLQIIVPISRVLCLAHSIA